MKRLLLTISAFGIFSAIAQTDAQSYALESGNTDNVGQTKTLTACSYLQENTAFENARVVTTNWPLTCADDFVVPASECWDVNQVTFNLWVSNITDATAMDFYFYDDNTGQPGAVNASDAVTSANWTYTLVGNNFGFDIYEFVVDLTAPINLCGGSGGTTYWFGISVTSVSTMYWEFSTSTGYGNNGVDAPSSAGPWNTNGDNYAFELGKGTGSSQTLVECAPFSITVGTNTYNSTGVYTDVLTSVLGCDSTVITDLTVNDTTSSIEVQTACGSYTWPEDGNTYTSTQMASYTIAGGGMNGCDSTVYLDLTINPAPVLSVTQVGMSLSSDDVGATYQWLDCDNAMAPLAGETNQSYTAPAPGNFAVEVTTPDGCVDTSACYLVDDSGVESNRNLYVSVYPNPTNGLVILQGINEVPGFVKMEITSVTGELVAQYITKESELDLSTYAEGVYFLNVYHENGIETIRLIKE